MASHLPAVLALVLAFAALSYADWNCDTDNIDDEGWWCSHCTGGIGNCYIDPKDDSNPIDVTGDDRAICVCVEDDDDETPEWYIHPSTCSGERLKFTLDVWGDKDRDHNYHLKIYDSSDCTGTMILSVNNEQGCYSDKRNECPEGTVVYTTGCDACLWYNYDDDEHGFALHYEVVPLPQVCGNGVVESPEECDDNNLVSGDRCSDVCITEYCGDGIVQAGINEQCDPPTDVCNPECQINICGDGYVCSGSQCGGDDHQQLGGRLEECDDGNTVDGDWCSSTCVVEFCGDGVVQGQLGEQCDDANSDDSDACINCVDAFCGDGYIWVGQEQCDDYDTVNGDGCDANCQTEACGNGIVQIGEACDDGNTDSGDGCDANCQIEQTACPAIFPQGCIADCDGVYANLTESSGTICECDLTQTPRDCSWTIAPAECLSPGDYINVTIVMYVDSGLGLSAPDDNSIDCCYQLDIYQGVGNLLIASHGTIANEDDDDFRQCYHNCAGGSCGSDCSDECAVPCATPDGVTTCPTPRPVICPMGRSYLIGGCSAIVQWQSDENRPGFAVTYEWLPSSVCGNGRIDPGEECDDGNIEDGDACPSDCMFEVTSSSSESSDCGNGVLDGCEECDDGNNEAGDCGSPECTIEPCCRFADPEHCYGRTGVNICPQSCCCEPQTAPCVKVMLSKVQEHAPCCFGAQCGNCNCGQHEWCPVCEYELGIDGPWRHTQEPGVAVLDYTTVPATPHGPIAHAEVRYWTVVPGPETFYSGDEAVVAPPGSVKMDVTVGNWTFSAGNNCSELWLVMIVHVPGMGAIATNSTAGTITAPLPCGLLFTAEFAHTAGAGSENPAVKTKMQLQDRFVRVFVKIARFSGSDVHYDPVFIVRPM